MGEREKRASVKVLVKERHSPQRADKEERKTEDGIDALSRKQDSVHRWFLKLGPLTVSPVRHFVM